MYEIHNSRDLHQPVLLVGLDGWIDAGLGGSAAVGALLDQVSTEVVATFDADTLLDHRSRRPVVRIVDGVNTGLAWPAIELRAGTDRRGRDVLLLVGPEPDLQWRAFVSATVALARDLGVGMMVGLGAFPAPVPHTRPVRLAATASSQELASTVGYVKGTIEVPAGVEAALEREFAQAGVPAVGLWARVPHYAMTMPYPAASAALVRGLSLVGLDFDAAELERAAELTHRRLEEIIAASEEHRAMVRQLEAQADSEAPPPLQLGDLPTGDEIAAELERFLRGER